MTLAQWNFVIGVNLTGQFLCAREAVKEFLRRGIVPERSVAAGKIICMSSVHEVIPWAGHVNYASSKGGIMMMMKSIAQEFAPKKIRVNSIGPGRDQNTHQPPGLGHTAGRSKITRADPLSKSGCSRGHRQSSSLAGER